MMGHYPKIPNGVLALIVRESQVAELCTAHCSPTHMEKDMQWFLKRDPMHPDKMIYINGKGDVAWQIPFYALPTIDEKQVWDRHPKFVALQRLRDGWAWYTSNIASFLP